MTTFVEDNMHWLKDAARFVRRNRAAPAGRHSPRGHRVRGRTGTVPIEGEIVINRPVDEVFDFVADERNEPRYNPHMSCVDQVSAGPIGEGTRFLAEGKLMGRTVDTTIEYTAYERPRLLASTSQSVVRLIKPMPTNIHGAITFDPVPQGTRMRWSWDVETRGALRLMSPMVAGAGRHQEQAMWTNLKNLLEVRELAASVGTGGM